MKVILKEIKPSSIRNFRVDPICAEKVETIKASIDEFGFWGGVVLRKMGDNIEAVAGTHRIVSAIAAGIKEADLYVTDQMDDVTAIQIYDRENSTQRGNTSTATTGSVAAAVKYVVREIVKGTSSEIRRRSEDTILGQLNEGKGVGRDAVLAILPDMNRNVVDQQLANLKASGEYLEIIREVDTEAQWRGVGMELSAQILAAAKKKDGGVTFDYSGVAKILTKPAHVDTFRGLVTNSAIKEMLPVKEQSKVAKKIVESARKGGVEISSRHIREQFNLQALKAKQSAALVTAKEEREWRERDRVEKLGYEMHNFARHAQEMVASADKITKLMAGWPKELEIPWTGEMRKWITEVVRFATKYKEVLDHVK